MKSFQLKVHGLIIRGPQVFVFCQMISSSYALLAKRNQIFLFFYFFFREDVRLSTFSPHCGMQLAHIGRKAAVFGFATPDFPWSAVTLVENSGIIYFLGGNWKLN